MFFCCTTCKYYQDGALPCCYDAKSNMDKTQKYYFLSVENPEKIEVFERGVFANACPNDLEMQLALMYHDDAVSQDQKAKWKAAFDAEGERIKIAYLDKLKSKIKKQN